jgi:hypothetical protein
MANNVNPIPEAYRGATPYLSAGTQLTPLNFIKERWSARSDPGASTGRKSRACRT